MAADVPADLRRAIYERAAGRCEYCLLPESAALHRHEPDHIVPVQHDGGTVSHNLALACFRCNRFKGPNVGSYDPDTGSLVAFFNPRIHVWLEHFRFDGAEIVPLTPEARVTVKIFRLNAPDRITERRALMEAGAF